jgi:hypothetical protein
MELRALIIQVCSEITEDMCRLVINITVCVEVARCNGGHIDWTLDSQRINFHATVFLFYFSL